MVGDQVHIQHLTVPAQIARLIGEVRIVPRQIHPAAGINVAAAQIQVQHLDFGVLAQIAPQIME